MIDPNKIVTEGKFDEDFFSDPVMVMIDEEIDALAEAEEELFLDGNADDMVLVDIVDSGYEPGRAENEIEMERVRNTMQDLPPQSQR